MERRKFLKSLGGAAAGLYFGTSVSALPAASAFKRAASGITDDERFWRLVRQQFLLPRNYHYFNTGGLGASPFMVTNKVKEMMDKEETYPSAGHNMEDWWRIKEKLAALFGPECKKEEVAFVSTATEGINLVVNGLPLQRGDEVITSTHEHVALNIPLLYRMQRDGIAIKTFEPDLQNGSGNLDRIEKLTTERTRLIFISHVTCTTGQIFPVEEIGQLAKSKNIHFALDGAQAVVQIPSEVRKIGADYYAYSGHKWLLGPKRTGILYVREDRFDTLRPSVVGAYSDKLVDMETRRLELHPTAQRYEYGTQNDALFYGTGEAADFVSTIGLRKIQQRNKILSERFYEGLRRIPGIEVLSPAEERYRSSMITFRVEDGDNGKISSELTKRRLRVRTVAEAKVDAIRVSFHVYNNEAEVKQLLKEISGMV